MEGCKRVIALLTGRAARHIVEAMAEGRECVYIVELPVNVMSSISVSTIASIVRTRRYIAEELGKADMVIIPGTVEGDASILWDVLGRPVYKGTRSAVGIPYILDYIEEGGALDTVRPADEILPRQPVRIEYEEAFRVGPVSVPRRGPPVALALEIPPDTPIERIEGIASRALEEGASIVIIGASPEWSAETLLARLERVTKAVGDREAAVGAEAPSKELAMAALDAGVDLVSTVPDVAISVADRLGNAGVIVGERDLEYLARATRILAETGVRKVIVDPVLDLPFMGFASSIARHIEAQRLGYPVLFSAANVSEEIEADTHGVHAVLAAIAVELGASVYLVVEDSYKGIHSAAEAREALRLASIAWSRGSTERGLFSRLLVVKQDTPPGKPRLLPGQPVGRVEPKPDPTGYFLIDVDHERGVIIIEFRGRGGTFRLEGSSALSLAREAVRRSGVTAEHAAYLGYELYKAELALRLGRTYTQDEPLIVAVWDHG